MNIWRLLMVCAAALTAADGFARGPADKVTGQFTIVGCCPIGESPVMRHRELSAHEPLGKHRQKGYLFSLNSQDRWYVMNFNDAANTCVNVYGDRRARIGGLISEGNQAVGRYFGYDIEDWGEPAYLTDTMLVLRFIGPGGPDDAAQARVNFLIWCDTGVYSNATVDRLWPQIVIDGNVKVHNYPGDGD